MSEQKSSLRKRYRNFTVIALCWGLVLAGSVWIAETTQYRLQALYIWGIIGLPGCAFLIIKSMSFKCPKCKKRYGMRDWPKFCPHCGAALEDDDSKAE